MRTFIGFKNYRLRHDIPNPLFSSIGKKIGEIEMLEKGTEVVVGEYVDGEGDVIHYIERIGGFTGLELRRLDIMGFMAPMDMAIDPA